MQLKIYKGNFAAFLYIVVIQNVTLKIILFQKHNVSNIWTIFILGRRKTPQFKNVPVVDVDQWPSKEQLGLDESQYEALQTALTKEVAVIQGPPGTGKTFLGLKVWLFLRGGGGVTFSTILNDSILVICGPIRDRWQV